MLVELFVILVDKRLWGVILILDECRVTGQCDSLFITLLFPSPAVFVVICALACKQAENRCIKKHVFAIF